MVGSQGVQKPQHQLRLPPILQNQVRQVPRNQEQWQVETPQLLI